MTRVVASAPGKINLALLVGEVDESGYHLLSSVFEGISLREYVEVEELDAATAGSPIGAVTTTRIEVHTRVYSVGPGSREPRFDPVATQAFAQFDGPGHLAFRAAQLLARPGVLLRITIHKTLPVAGGMAGGSADAAAALVAMNALASDPVAQCDLGRLGRTLGADVPACLVGGIALGLGRGGHGLEQRFHRPLLHGSRRVPAALLALPLCGALGLSSWWAPPARWRWEHFGGGLVVCVFHGLIIVTVTKNK